jgi:hypothetical protein
LIHLAEECLIKHLNEGKIKEMIEVKGRRGIISKQLLNGRNGKIGYRKFEKESQDRTLWKSRFGRGYGSVDRQTTKSINGINI